MYLKKYFIKDILGMSRFHSKNKYDQNILLIVFLFIIVILILLLAGYLFIDNRDSSAMNLIQQIITISAAAMGGYSWGKRIN